MCFLSRSDYVDFVQNALSPIAKVLPLARKESLRAGKVRTVSLHSRATHQIRHTYFNKKQQVGIDDSTNAFIATQCLKQKYTAY